MRVELAKWGIHVVVIQPASVKTPIWAKSKKVNEDVLDHASPAVMELYGEGINAVRQSAAELERAGMPVGRIVDAVRQLRLTCPAPRRVISAATKPISRGCSSGGAPTASATAF